VTATTYRYRTWRVTIGTLYLLIGAAFFFDTVGVFHANASLFWPLFLIALGVGMLLRRARRLQVEEDRSAQLAVAEERVRIARELHDVVAHGVSLMTIQISAARRVATSKPESADDSLAAAEQTGRQTLNELNSMLSVLRGADASIGAAAWPNQASDGAAPGQGRSPIPRLADLAELVDSLKKAGRQASFKVLGEPPDVPSSVALVIYRVVQEALTNAVRYAPDALISVELIYSPDAISVFVDDEGPGAGVPPGPGGGHGLLGMSERLATVGGSLSAGPRSPGPGWRVHATVPIFAMVS
jgi:signal transduction histidine kinase